MWTVFVWKKKKFYTLNEFIIIQAHSLLESFPFVLTTQLRITCSDLNTVNYYPWAFQLIKAANIYYLGQRLLSHKMVLEQVWFPLYLCVHFSSYNEGKKAVVLIKSVDPLLWFMEAVLIAFYHLDRIPKYGVWVKEVIFYPICSD